MHELSIALDIVDLASQEASRHAGTATAVHMNLGALSGVVKEALLSAWEMARLESPVQYAELVIADVPAAAHCSHCQADRQILSIQDCCCCECGAPLLDLIRGRELEIVALELDS